MAWLAGVAQNLLSSALWAGGGWLAHLLGRKIQITSPGSQQYLEDKKTFGSTFSYRVNGRLKKKPDNHVIWLVVEDEQKRIWPQGFYKVRYNEQTTLWEGRIASHHSPGHVIKIIAVVAPETSDMFFDYFQMMGSIRGDKFEPLRKLPSECLNTISVEAKIPS